MNMVMPTIYSLAKTGKITMINYRTELQEDGSWNIINEHGYVDGKQQCDITNIKVGKNIGKANETTAGEQAVFEMKASWKAKKDKKNYTENANGIPSVSEMSLLPMLAEKFINREKSIVWPALVQPKLDGLRCLAHKNDFDQPIVFTSRTYQVYNTLGHLFIQVNRLINIISDITKVNSSEIVLDGELYHPELNIQEINRRVRGATEEDMRDVTEIEYHIYDIGIIGMPNKDRNDILVKAMKFINEPMLKFVFTEVVNNKEEMIVWHNRFVQQGYEGIIIRNFLGLYLFGHRSADLQKFKLFQDAEFEVVGYTCADTGREKGAIIFECIEPNPLNGHDGKFNVRPKGRISDRIDMYNNNPEQYIGKLYTVRFAMDKSEDNIPQFPVGIVFRLEEDLP